MRISDWSSDVCSSDLAARGDYPALSADTPIDLLVVGGSQSARVFGEVVPPALLALSPEIRSRLRVALQYKGDDADAIAARLREAGIAAEVRPFFDDVGARSEEHTSELQSLMRISYAVFCLKQKEQLRTPNTKTPI